MKIVRGIKIGGLQSKIFNLLLVFIIAFMLAYSAVSLYNQRELGDIVQEASAQQQASVSTSARRTAHTLFILCSSEL